MAEAMRRIQRLQRYRLPPSFMSDRVPCSAILASYVETFLEPSSVGGLRAWPLSTHTRGYAVTTVRYTFQQPTSSPFSSPPLGEEAQPYDGRGKDTVVVSRGTKRTHRRASRHKQDTS